MAGQKSVWKYTMSLPMKCTMSQSASDPQSSSTRRPWSWHHLSVLERYPTGASNQT